MRELAKVELHLHLEGAANPTLMRDMAKEKSIDISGAFTEQGTYRFEGFQSFLRTYEAVTSVLQAPADYARLTLDVLRNSAEQGVVYTELFLSPDFCGGRDVAAWREYVHAMQEAADQARRETGIQTRGIVTCIRHFDPMWSRETALCAAETKGDFITGFGIGGDETRGKPADFAYAFDLAREAELGLTAHAGEWGGAGMVRDTLRDLRVSRIGHGVQAIDDLALVDYLAEHEITLEVCPGSNVALGVYPAWHRHPISTLLERGVKVTVSTDDPPFFHTNLVSEYENLNRTFDWDADVFKTVNMNAVRAAFCDEDTRAQLTKDLESAYG
ncbi:MAG: adenosine deaminase [Pseudomonadota bacterium]|nr:adenosine deaminase [Pseudomonadota bacterium]